MSTVVGHLDDLKAVLDLLRAEIELEDQCDYGDPPDQGEPSRTAVRAHFGDLAAALDEWDREIERGRSAPGALWLWLAEFASELGITEPPFLVGSLIDFLAILTADRSGRWQLRVPHELRFEHFSDRVGDRSELSLYLEAQMVARLSDEPASDAGRELETACALIQALFDEAQTCAPAGEIGDARDSLLARKEHLLDRVEADAVMMGIRFADDCPFCVQEAGGGEVLASRLGAGPGQTYGPASA
jgi:hypothetical protein